MNIKSSNFSREAQSIETFAQVKSKLFMIIRLLIDVRDIRKLWKEGTIENSKHIPRGMLDLVRPKYLLSI